MSKDRFLKVYANLPEDVRKEIIVIIDDKPYSWNAAFVEINGDTELGQKMVSKLSEMELI